MPCIRRPMRYAHVTGKTDVSYSSDGKYIFTCGIDGDIRIWLTVEDDDPASICAGDTAHSVLVDSENRILVSNDSLLIQILTFPEGDPNGILTQFTAIVTHMAFDTQRKVLAAGSDDMTVKVIRLSDNNILCTLTDFEGPILGVALNHNAELVAASCGDGSLKVFRVDDQTVIQKFDCVPNVNNYTSAEVLCRASFEPTTGKYFAYPDLIEVNVLDTSTWAKITVFSEPRAKGPFSIVAFSPCGTYLAAATCKGCICVWHLDNRQLIGYSSHPSKHGVCSMAWNPNGNGELVYCDYSGQLGAVEECCLASTTVEENKKPNTEEASIDPFQLNGFGVEASDDEDDDNVFSLEKLKNETLGTQMDHENDDNGSVKSTKSHSRAPSIDYRTIIANQLQPPFQPSSTPDHLSERYLIWNDIGIIRLFDDETPFIDITFHDTSLHNSMHLRNTNNHTLASLSSKAVALASVDKIVCIPLSGKEWQNDTDEEIVCVTTSEKFVCIATKTRLLRVFTIHGTQRDVICIPGPVVTLTANNDMILVAYHSGPGVGDDQNIMTMIINIKGMELHSTEIRLPLSPGSKLTWLGFTDLGSFASYDSNGVLRIFNSKSCVWHPVFDYTTRRSGVSDGLFIINVNETEQFFNAITCKGSIYPQIAPKPIVGPIKFVVPLCQPDMEKSVLEDQFIRSLNSNATNTRLVIESALKLFSQACGNDNDQRAFELTEILSIIPKFAEICYKYAAKKNKAHLADKISEFIESIDLFAEDEGQENTQVSNIIERRANLLNELPKQRIAPVEISQPSLQPLRVKQVENNRIKVCKENEADLNDEEDAVKTPKSLDRIVADPENKTPRNPFSKLGKSSLGKNPNPFNVSGNLEKTITPVNKKRKEVEPAGSEENTQKQRKLDSFRFERRVD